MYQRTNFSIFPLGSRVEIAGRVFERIAVGSFWREELGPNTDRVTELPAVTLSALEESGRERHRSLPQ